MATAPPVSRLRASRGGSSAGLVVLLAAAAVGGGLYFTLHRAQRSKGVSEDNFARVAALAQAEQHAEQIKHAIRERRAIVGMTSREVELAKGPPALKQRGESLSDADRAKGGVENWVYDLGAGKVSTVLFGANGVVIRASEIEAATDRP